MRSATDLGNGWFKRPAPQADPRLRLFCLPYAGGGAALFRLWPQFLPAEIELCAVELPGRGSRMRETPYTDTAALVAALSAQLAPLLDRPFALFGHSLGAVVAFELARQLRASGQPGPTQIFVSGRRAPQLVDADPPLHPLPDAAFVAGMIRRYNGIPRSLLQEPELLRLFLPTLRADLTMAETHRYVEGPPLDCPITAFGGQEDQRASRDDLAAWGTHTSAAFAVRIFPGDHFFLQHTGAALVAAICAELARAACGSAPASPGGTALSHRGGGHAGGIGSYRRT